MAFLPLSTRDAESLARSPANQAIAQHNERAAAAAAVKQALTEEQQLAEAEERAAVLRRTLAVREHERRLEAALRAMAEDWLMSHPEIT